ncbi:MAG: Ig-like domain-containing protein [Sphingobacteriaceae bacterium]
MDIVFGGAPNPAYLTSGTTDPITGLDPVGEGYLRLTNNSQQQTGFIHNKTSFPSKTGLKIEFEFFTYGGQADGITFFLYDATYDDIQKPFNIGGFGGSLGYAQYKDTNNGKIYPGVSGGYLGIGIDEYGNFSNPIENRSGGIVGPVAGGLSPNSITLRGKGSGSSTDADNYRYLTSKRTTDTDLGFNLTSGGRHSDPAHPEYRKAIVILDPIDIGYKITVKIVTGGPLGKTHTVIDGHEYKEPAPTMVRYGIASSTGFYHNYHEIRNVRINTFEPLAIDDLGYITSRNKEINIPILDNDIDGNNVINPSSVAIRKGSSPASITVSTTGVITYKPQTGYVGPDVFYYTVKDIDGLVSNEAKVEVDVQLNSVKPVGVKDEAKTNINTPITIAVQPNDVHNIDVTVTSTPTSTAGGTTLVNANGTITYTPKPGFTGTDTFTYTLKNIDDLISDPITVTITVNAPPVAMNDTKTAGMEVPVDIDIAANDTDSDGTLNKSTVVITDLPLGLVTVNATTGVVTFQSKVGFVGKDVFYYTIKDNEGLVSNKAKVEIEIKPSGKPDNVTTLLNTPITISVLTNDPSKTGVTVVPFDLPLKGTILVNADNTVKYTPTTGSVGSDTFTYKIKTVDGLESDPITVTIIINSAPVANNDNKATLMDEFVEIDVPTNDTDADGTVNKSSVAVKTQPAHGTVSLPDAQGNITYTPHLGYVGSDSFTYTIKDNNGTESNIATVTITITSVPKIGLSKGIPVIKDAVNGSFIVRFTFTVGNYGIEPLEKISIKDNLATTFAGAEVKVVAINSSGSLKANNNFNGIGDIELLDPSSTLAANTTATVELILNVTLISTEGSFQNTAIAEGYSSTSDQKTTDASVAGDKPDPFTTGDVTPSGPTFFHLKKGPLYIPEGFSPNGDGINDLFIVSNSQGRIVNLDVYNRWGNRVYKSSAYENNWDGRCTEGVFIGQDLPVGTYYYIIVIDNTDKHVGYITINR